MKNENPFQGEWEISDPERNHSDLKKIRWRFSEPQKVYFGNKIVTFFGKLTEILNDDEPCETAYFYYPDENELCIDCSTYEDDGFVSQCVEESYRIEQINDNQIHLESNEKIITLYK